MSQPERMLPSLLPENLSIDERDIPDLLAFLHALAGQINYFNTDDQVAGDWASFLESDTHFLIAILSRMDISPIAKIYGRWRTGAGDVREPEKQRALSAELFVALDALEKKISMFQRHFSGLSDKHDMLREIALTLEDYLQELQDLLSSADPDLSSIKGKHTYLQSISDEYLRTNALLAQDYSPHLGMLLNFLHLYTHLQGDLNGLTRKHLDLYYQQLLGMPYQPAVPDQVAVFFETDPSMAAPIRLGPGTQLVAGIAGSERPLLYELKDAVVLSPTRIAALKTLYISNNPIGGRMGNPFGAGNYDPAGSKQDQKEAVREARVYQGSYTRPEPRDFLKTGHVVSSWPILGEDQSGLSEKERTMIDSAIGLVIGSPLFYLTEGSRMVCLEFVFTAASFRSFTTFMKNFPESAEKSEDLIHLELLSDAFLIDYTGPAGWEPIRKYRLRATNENSLELSFGIDQVARPFQVYKKELHKLPYTAKTPLIRLLINNYASHGAYSFLKELQIERVNIRTSAREFHPVKLQNNIGVLSAASPFQIFGPLPSVGSYLDMKNTNVFNRYTKQFCIRIEWLNLPRERDGFGGYYEGYSGGLRNRSFKISLGNISGGRSAPIGQTQEFPLFDSAEPNTESLKNVTVISGVDMKKFEFPNELLQEKEYSSQESIFKEGAIRMELIAPAEAFGHRQYPDILRHYSSRSARKLLLPNQPYTPVVKSISVDYTLEHSALLSGNTAPGEDPGNSLMLIHQYPFGYDELFPQNDQYAYPFMPQFGGLNHLYIGLKDGEPNQELSLLFQLEERKFHHSAHSPAAIVWSFLRENRWVDMDTKEILSDSTSNLIHSGILRLMIPSSIQQGNTILDPDLYWLRASTRAARSSMARVTAIYSHGVQAVRIPDPGEKDYGEFRLPPGSIKDLKKRIPQIKGVWQLFPSFGGQPAETSLGYYIRVSERLRHKHRPLSARDIEQFILKEFPGIYLAKCFGIGSREQLILPGVNVQVIVIPKEQENGRFHSDQPHVSLDTLFRIKDFLSTVLSPFAQIEVGNPVYEKVKIACSILFRNTDTSDYGLLLAQLHEDIRRYLCPWLYEEGTRMIIGGQIYIADILNCIKNLPYISYVTGFSVAHFFRKQDINTGGYDAKMIDSSRHAVVSISGSIPGAVLIPAEQHLITVLNRAGYLPPPPFGIGSLLIGEEFFPSRQAEERASREAGIEGGETEAPGYSLRPDPWQERFTLIINHHH